MISSFIIDSSSIKSDDILSAWKWRFDNLYKIVFISSLGDLFFVGNDNSVYWLQTDSGDLEKVAENLSEFESFLTDETKIDKWFLPSFLQKIINAGIHLNRNQVYSYRKLPVIGGEYSILNIVPTDVKTHFEFTGAICEQIKDLPDGTKVSMKVT